MRSPGPRLSLMALALALLPMAAAWAGPEALVRLLESGRCRGCQLSDADLVLANLRDADLRGAQLQQPIPDEIPQGGAILGNSLTANPSRQGHLHGRGQGGLALGQHLNAESLIVNLQAQPLGKELVSNLAKPLLDQGRNLPNLDRGRHRRGHRTAPLNPAMAIRSPRPHRCGQAHGCPVGG